MIGQTLLEVANRHKVDIEGPCNGGGAPVEIRRSPTWVEHTYGEGPTCFYCHVQIPSTFNHLFEPASTYEQEGLEEIWEEESLKTSRLACQLKLDRKHDGLVVFVPDAPPTDVI